MLAKVCGGGCLVFGLLYALLTDGWNKQNCDVSATCLPKMALKAAIRSSSTVQHQFGEMLIILFI